MLGYIEVDLQNLIDQSTKWVVNQAVELNPPQNLVGSTKFASFGDIYIQAKFSKDGDKDDLATPEVFEDIRKIREN